MSGKWVGFTEDDLRNFNIGEKSSNVPQKPLRVAKLLPNSRQQAKKNVARGRISHSEFKPKVMDEGKPFVSSNMEKQLLVPSTVTEPLLVPSSESVLNKVCSPTTIDPVKDKTDDNDSLQRTNSSQPSVSGDSPNHVSVCLRIKEGRSYEVMGSEKVSLEDFQARQKLMEEQNRCRKEFLSKALADRKKQTHAESQRLQQIQDELQKLDMLLSNDVSILRNQIEVASLDFNEAEKRYNKLEKEFLDAKLKMYSKLEQKELLTEHLCTIIEQNEIRKARKLSELMDKLDLGVTIGVPILEENHVKSKEMPSTDDTVSDEVSESTDSTSITALTKKGEILPTQQLNDRENTKELGVELPDNKG